MNTRKGAPAGTPLPNAATAKSQVPSEGNSKHRHAIALERAARYIEEQGDALRAARLRRQATELLTPTAAFDGEQRTPAAVELERRQAWAWRMPAFRAGGDLAAHDPWLDGVA